MARLVVLGGGVAGHTTATFAAKWLGSQHEVELSLQMQNGTGFHQTSGLALDK